MLNVWTIYDHPSDFPDSFVARLYQVDELGVQATSQVILSPDVAKLRAVFLSQGLTVLTRSPNDDPTIIEVWM